jgi:hypothetical protein
MKNSTINFVLNILIVIVFIVIVVLSMGGSRDTENFFDNQQFFYTMGEKGSEVRLPCDRSYCDRMSIPEYSNISSRDGFRLGIGPRQYGDIQVPREEGLLAEKEIKKDPTQNYRFLPLTDNRIIDYNSN